MDKKIMGGKEQIIALVMLMLLGAAMTVSVSVATRSGFSSAPIRNEGSEKPSPPASESSSHQNQKTALKRIREMGDINPNSFFGLEEDDLLPENHYYTMYQYHSQANLKIKLDGNIEWNYGNPNLYSLFHERLVIDPDSNSRDHMYVLEATASGHLLCMNAKGRFYTIPMAPQKSNGGDAKILTKQNEFKVGLDEKIRIRHKLRKERRNRRRRLKKSFPPPDCLFKTYEFNAEESYERAVGIYSYLHSNITHARFLSRNPRTEKVRSYLRAFTTLYRHSQVKITQLPVRYLNEMISRTRFGREDKFNGNVRQCIIQFLTCPEHKEKMRMDANNSMLLPSKNGRGAGGRRAHLHKLIERCKRRALETDKLPKCHENKNSAKFKRKLRKAKNI